jgi:hypothetical protein
MILVCYTHHLWLDSPFQTHMAPPVAIITFVAILLFHTHALQGISLMVTLCNWTENRMGLWHGLNTSIGVAWTPSFGVMWTPNWWCAMNTKWSVQSGTTVFWCEGHTFIFTVWCSKWCVSCNKISSIIPLPPASSSSQAGSHNIHFSDSLVVSVAPGECTQTDHTVKIKVWYSHQSATVVQLAHIFSAPVHSYHIKRCKAYLSLSVKIFSKAVEEPLYSYYNSACV